VTTSTGVALGLEHLHRFGFYLSKLDFGFGNDKTVSTGYFLKSKVWTWIKILPKARHFGRVSCPSCLMGDRLDEHISYKTSPSALISPGREKGKIVVTHIACVFCRPDQCSLNSYVDDNSCLLVSSLPALLYTMSSERDVYIYQC
jgi:hypothetical protein